MLFHRNAGPADADYEALAELYRAYADARGEAKAAAAQAFLRRAAQCDAAQMDKVIAARAIRSKCSSCTAVNVRIHPLYGAHDGADNWLRDICECVANGRPAGVNG